MWVGLDLRLVEFHVAFVVVGKGIGMIKRETVPGYRQGSVGRQMGYEILQHQIVEVRNGLVTFCERM